MYVSFHGGKAFMDTSLAHAREEATLALNVCFNGQRFRGKRVPAGSDPAFTEGFLFELPTHVNASIGSALPDAFLACAEPLQIAITRHLAADDVALLGCLSLDWRQHVLRACESPASHQVPAACAVLPDAHFSTPHSMHVLVGAITGVPATSDLSFGQRLDPSRQWRFWVWVPRVPCPAASCTCAWTCCRRPHLTLPPPAPT